MEQARACKTINELARGDRVERVYKITDDDLLAFGKLSGDFNPIHFDDQYASRSIFGRRIAHGMISVAKFSGIFGMDMPGLGTLWLSQSVRFLKPVFVNEPYTAIAEVTDLDDRRASVATWVEDSLRVRVLEGEAVVIPITEKARTRLDLPNNTPK